MVSFLLHLKVSNYELLLDIQTLSPFMVSFLLHLKVSNYVWSFKETYCQNVVVIIAASHPAETKFSTLLDYRYSHPLTVYQPYEIA